MFYLNNDDMDEMFQQAAEHYPLKTQGASDWEKLSATLREEIGVSVKDTDNFKNEKKRRTIIWWFFLLPLGWIGHDSWQKLQIERGKNSQLREDIQLQHVSSRVQEPEKQVQRPSIANEAHIKIAISDPGTSNKQSLQKSTSVSEKREVSSKNASFGTDKFLPTKSNEKNKTSSNTLNSKHRPGEDIEINAEDGNSINNDKEKIAGTAKRKTILSTNPVFETNEDVQENTNGIKINGSGTEKSSNKQVEKSQEKTNDKIDNKEKKVIHSKKDFHFYAGLMVGADISTVKFQSVKGVGNSGGLLLGYHFSHSRFNIETGFYLDTKKYYSSGEYFNRNNVPYLANADLQNVNGSCNMFEIPVNVRYSIKQSANTSFFAVLGMSSYLMNKESYSYGIKYTNGYIGYHNYSYDHSTQNWFSVINLSLGYEHRLGRIGDIRVEPYAKLPISGIGKGSLPIMSAGLNVGITRRF